MRLGEILVEAQLVTAKQLSFALEYASGKSLFLGRALTLLRYVKEKDIDKALLAQELIAMEMAVPKVIEALRTSAKEDISMQDALQDASAHMPPRVAQADGFDPSVIDGTPAGYIKAGDALLLKDRRQEAEAQFKRALSLLEQQMGPDHLKMAPVLVRLGNTYLALNWFEQARVCYERVLLLRTKNLPDDHLEIAQTFESLADLYYAEQDEPRATWAYLSALDVLEKRLPGQLVHYVAMLRKLTDSMEPTPGTKVPVGEILRNAGLLSKEHLDSALRMAKLSSLPLGVVLRENGMVHDREFKSALKAQFCIKQGVLSEQLAINLLVRACRRGISLDRVLHEAGILISTEGMLNVYRQIAAELDHLIAAESSEISSRHEVGPIACRLGALYEQAGDKTQAELYYNRAITCLEAEDNEGDLTVATACAALAWIQQEQNRPEDAVIMLRMALRHRRIALGDADELTLQTVEDIAAIELMMNNADGALNMLQDVLACREALEQDGLQLFRAVMLSGDCMVKQENYEGAETVYRAAIGLAKTEDRPTLALASVSEKLADLFMRRGAVHPAVTLYEQAIVTLEAIGTVEGKRIEDLRNKVANSRAAVEG